MVFLWFSNEFAEIFLAIACSLHVFRKEPISAQFSQSFGRPWTPSGPLSDAFGTALGSPWAHLGPPWTLQTTPGTILNDLWDPLGTQTEKLSKREPPASLKKQVFYRGQIQWKTNN